MPQVIQCPTCSKKFKLPDRPPATFTCTGCQTVMDLSGFREAPAGVAEAAAAAEPAASSPTRSSSRSSSGGSSSAKRRAGSSGAAARARARKGDDEGDDEEEGGGRGAPPKKNNNALIIGSLFAVVVLGGIALLALKKKAPPPTAKPVVQAPAFDPAAAAPAMTEEAAMEAAPPPAPAHVMPSKVQFHAIEHHPDAKPEERTKIDELIQKAVFENSGSDGVAAEEELVSKYGLKAAPRLVNVFSTVKMGVGFEDRFGKIQASVADRVLRKIDGYLERTANMKQPIKPQSDPAFAERIARYWVAWWDNGTWKDNPQKPWNERIDGAATEAGSGMDDGSGMKSDGGASGK